MSSELGSWGGSVYANGAFDAQPKYIRIVYELLESSAHSVKYEAATTLTTLTQNPAAVKGASINWKFVRRI